MHGGFHRATSRNIACRALHCALIVLGLQVSTANAIPPEQRAVLDALYQDTGGPAWTHGSDPLQADGWERDPGTECSGWYGVICDAQGRITSIVLPDNHLTGGPLPDLTPLGSLRSFYVYNNEITGPIPNLAGLTAFQIFFAYNNQLSGSIPPLSGVGLNGLLGFNVSNNELTGPIPALNGAHALQSFYADGNHLTGSIPDLSGLSYLVNFDVSSNELTGELPPLSGVGLTSLKYVWVDHNQIGGSIPALDGLTTLRQFYANDNELSGSIPSLASLTALQEFHVENNLLTGPPPTPPSPSVLVADGSSLCPNRLDLVSSPGWNVPTGYTPWYYWCNELFLDGFDTPP
jgi:hypothetical protein